VSRRPVIGLTGDIPAAQSPTGDVLTRNSYAQAVLQAGGYPVTLLPSEEPGVLESIRVSVAGLLFTGGGDLRDGLYGAPAHPETQPVDPVRERWDMLLMRTALAWEHPLLAICLGIQELNVACGGSLHPHLPDREASLEHRRIAGKDSYHPVVLSTGSLAQRITGMDELRVNSTHHQAVGRLGKGLCVVARAPDGVAEALERDVPEDRFLLGTQWHPERIQDQPEQRRILCAFVDACRVFADRTG